MDWPWWQWLSLDGQRTLFEHQRSHSSHLDRDQMLTATWHVTRTPPCWHMPCTPWLELWIRREKVTDVFQTSVSGYCYDMCFVSMLRSISNLLNSPSQRNWTSKVWISWAGCLSNQPEPVLAKETWASGVSPCVTMCSYSMLQLSQFLKPFLNDSHRLSPATATILAELWSRLMSQHCNSCCVAQRFKEGRAVQQRWSKFALKDNKSFHIVFLFNLQTYILDL